MSSFFVPLSQYIGIEIDNNFIKSAQLTKSRKGFDLVLMNKTPVEEFSAVFSKVLKKRVLTSVLNAKEILIRPMEIPLKRKKDLFEALPFHAEPLLPFPVEGGILQTQILHKGENGTSLSLCAARKNDIAHHLDRLKEYHINPERVISKPHALATLSTLMPEHSSPLLLAYKGEDEIMLVLIEKGIVLASRSIELASSRHRELAEGVQERPLSLQSKIQKNLYSEVQKTLLSFAATHKTKKCDTLYFFGNDPEVREILQQASGKPILQPTLTSFSLTSEELNQFCIPIGAALSYKTEINFRQNEFKYPFPFRHLKKPLSFFFGLSFFLTAILFFFGEISCQNKRAAAEQAFCDLSLLVDDKGSTAIPQSVEEYDAAASFLEDKINQGEEAYPLLPQVPKVKEVLSWLSQLSDSGHIRLESFHYQMVKYPTLSHKQDKYKIRVDLELFSENPQAARTLYDALKNPNLMVDDKEEILWVPSKGKYKASFYLKDKTKYF